LPRKKAIRYIFDGNYRFEYGKADILREGKSGYIITMGCLVPRALKAFELLKEAGISIGVINMSCPLEIDKKVIDKAIATGLILTMEDHHIDTGLGMTIAKYLLEKKYAGKFLRRGITRYGSSGEPEYLFKQEGMDPASVAALLKSHV